VGPIISDCRLSIVDFTPGQHRFRCGARGCCSNRIRRNPREAEQCREAAGTRRLIPDRLFHSIGRALGVRLGRVITTPGEAVVRGSESSS
jgi:hypothetical protein